MKSLKQVVGENLIALRKANHLTQFELAEKLNYSDKSISKWENGDTLPDLETLNELCKFYGVTLDYLTHEVHENKNQFIIEDKRMVINKAMIVALIDSIIWMIATIIFVYSIVLKKDTPYWIVYVYSVPATCLVTAVFCRNYFRMSRKGYFIIWTIFIWSGLASLFFSIIFSREIVIWPLFLLGIPAEVSLSIWAFIKKIKTVK